jgi:hypothetical protein
MMSTSSGFKRWLGLAAILLFGCVQSAIGAWWEFGRREGEPVITELRVNTVDATRLVDNVVLSREDLVSGVVTIRGRAEVRQGVIGLVEYSIDGGRTWRTATLGDRGMFVIELKPDVGRSYAVTVRAITTVGKQTDDADYSFKLEVGTGNTTEEVRSTFLRMLEAYRGKNRSEFMRYVSDDFEGIVSALDEAVSNDFRNFDNIRIEPNITRISPFGGGFEIYFTFNRQVYSTRNGRLLKDAAASTMMFRREAQGYRLTRLAAPLIFGVSNPTDVATSVTTQSVGQQVITVNPTTGAATTATQSATAPTGSSAASTLDTGTRTMTFSTTGPTFNFNSFEFANGGTVHSTGVTGNAPAAYLFQGDFAVGGTGNIHFKNTVQARTCGTTFAALLTAPTTGYAAGPTTIGPVAGGQCYAFTLVGPKYGAIEIINFTTNCPAAACNSSVSFRYKYQNDGTTSLQ